LIVALDSLCTGKTCQKGCGDDEWPSGRTGGWESMAKAYLAILAFPDKVGFSSTAREVV
jgi:hypothetical protein